MGDYRPTRRSVRQLAGADRQRPSYCDGRHRGYTLVSGRASCPLRNRGENAMPKYVIERDIPGAGKLSSQELKAISQKSCGVLRNLGPPVQWLPSYVTGHNVYYVYLAPHGKAVQGPRSEERRAG